MPMSLSTTLPFRALPLDRAESRETNEKRCSKRRRRTYASGTLALGQHSADIGQTFRLRASSAAPSLAEMPPAQMDLTHRSDVLPTGEVAFDPPAAALQVKLEQRFACGSRFTLRGKTYEVERILGKGGFGLVLGVYEEASKESFAAKVGIDGEWESLAIELMTWLRLHANVKRVFAPQFVALDVIDDGNFTVLVMERAMGTLKDEIERGISVQRALELALALASGLSDLHSIGLIHQDVKPANVLIDASECACALLADYGSTANLETWPEHQRALAPTDERRVIAITPRYMAPELRALAAHARRTSTFHADVWSWALVAMQLLGAELPCRPYESVEAMQDQMRDLEQAREIPSACIYLLCRCLSPERSLRPSMSEVVQELDLMLKDQGAIRRGRGKFLARTVQDVKSENERIRLQAFDALHSHPSLRISNVVWNQFGGRIGLATLEKYGAEVTESTCILQAVNACRSDGDLAVCSDIILAAIQRMDELSLRDAVAHPRVFKKIGNILLSQLFDLVSKRSALFFSVLEDLAQEDASYGRVLTQ